MKKIIYSILVGVALIVSVASCTEENVTPASKTSAGGGSTMDNNVIVG